ncbi:ABC transporter ATP-binding protein [Salinadaptatus halalkaliphilus]|uniref:ABC transporter ATP-binding protein n=1 Tax=Salinadaptatus halalkaliphilus TaxID=2419781 RepID=A0A4S3TKC7_9EURY|nr:ABC transporter ATP-binding protein [Salinadaptatus halalkaliphilus]THE63028.1 ABC transporter ATP-binding protein [Salinadaptatus halalkaliphilus]
MSPLLSVEGIDTYYGDSHILHGTSLEVAEGEVVGLLGRNGVGKSTTLRSILGHTPPERGEITFRGDSITDLKPNDISKRGIGWVPEDRRIFPALTVEENLKLARRTDTVPFETAYDYFPKLEELSSSTGGQLSGGEQQMLAIARGILGDFDLLLIDEPTEGLAPMIVDDVVDALEEIQSEATILLVEQSVDVVNALADRIYIMDKGRIVAETDDIERDSELIDQHLKVSTE